MLLYRDDGRIYCEDFSFILPPNVVLEVDRSGNDVELHDPEGRWIIKFIQNFGMEENEDLFQSHYDFYYPETPPEHPVPFSSSGGITGEALLHSDDIRYYWDVRFRPVEPIDLDVFWINLEATKEDITWEEFQKVDAMLDILESLRIENHQT